jgi:Mg2+ and Co2+ transporter CorA
MQRIIRICGVLEKPSDLVNHTAWSLDTSGQQEEIQSTITRAELYFRQMKMMQDVLQSLTAVLYNHISKNDARPMKTIAVVTLIILPSTLVSSIFSTGIFNFHADESFTGPKVISAYGWVYLLTCLLLTFITLVAWICWYLWGNIWLDKFRRSWRKHSSCRYN